MKRSNLIVALGLAVFVVGAAATYFVLRDDGDAASASGDSTVLYAAEVIPAGTTGSNAVNQGLVKSKNVAPEARPAGAFSDPSELVGKTAAVSVAEGTVLTETQFPVAQTKIGTLKIPDGKTALAVELAHVPGGGGFVQSGDRVDIFGALKEGPCDCPLDHKAGLVMQNTEVLSVSAASGAVTAAAEGATVGPTAAPQVFVLAVTPPEAERLIYLTTFQSLYFALVPRDQPPVPPTPNAGLGDALKLLP